MTKQETIGIDFSKDHLDACDAGPKDHRRFSNDAAGLTALCRWARERGDVLVVFEGEADQELIRGINSPLNGAYHRDLEQALARRGLAFAKVNPRQARRFAEGEPSRRHRFEPDGERQNRQDRPRALS